MIQNLLWTVSSLLVLAPDVLGQKPEPRAFVPPGFRAEAFVDFAALKDQGMWDAIRGSAAGMLFGMAEAALGFELAELDKLWAFPETRRIEGTQQGGVLILAGSGEVTLPPNQSGYEEGKVGDWVALVRPRQDDPDQWIQVRPGLLLYATRHLIEPLVTGAQQPGVPEGDMLALTSVRGSMAHLVVALEDGMLADLPFPLPEGAVAPDDRPRFAMLRLRLLPAASADEEPQVVLEGAVRCENGSKGPAALKALVDAGLESARKHPRLAALKSLWAKVQVAVAGRDLTIALPLGRPRDAAGRLAMLIAPIMLFGTTVEAATVAPVQIDDVAPQEAVPEPPKPAPQPAPQPQGGRGGD